jgi:hypothetical protein
VSGALATFARAVAYFSPPEPAAAAPAAPGRNAPAPRAHTAAWQRLRQAARLRSTASQNVISPGRVRPRLSASLRDTCQVGARGVNTLSARSKREAEVVVGCVMYEEPLSGNPDPARLLWEATQEETENATEPYGLLLSRIVVELQDIRATMSASVSRLQS